MPMTVTYALDNLPERVESTLFLAGPTPRGPDTPSWRPGALRILEDLGYGGTVLVPEDRSGRWRHGYDDQVDWECSMRRAADIVAFWVPRDLEPADGTGRGGAPRMPAFTTNVEFGLDLGTGKVYRLPATALPDAAARAGYVAQKWSL